MKKIAFIAFLVAFVVTSNAQSDHIKINSEGLKKALSGTSYSE